MAGQSGKNDNFKKLIEIKPSDFRIDEGAKFVDVAAGKVWVAVVTDNGKIHACSTRLWDNFSECRSNAENSKNHPYELRMPDGYKA